MPYFDSLSSVITADWLLHIRAMVIALKPTFTQRHCALGLLMRIDFDSKIYCRLEANRRPSFPYLAYACAQSISSNLDIFGRVQLSAHIQGCRREHRLEESRRQLSDYFRIR
jgi:sigma54-dependent transcription regulator